MRCVEGGTRCDGDATGAERETIDEAVGILVRRFPAVVSLEVKGRGETAVLTDQGLQSVISLASLTFLDLSGCRLVTDEGMRAVRWTGTALKTLNLNWCNKVTDLGVRAVVSSCTALTALNLRHCYELTDVGVRALSSLSALTSLNLCLTNVTAAGVQALRSTTAAPNLHIEF